MLLVQQAPLGTLLTGHYTFLAVNHPGPFFLYIRYFAQIFLGSFVASPYGAHLFGMMATSAACAGVLATTLHRLTGGGLAGAVAAVTAVLMMLLQFAGQDVLATLLMSDVVILPFLTFLATATLLLRGSLFGLLSATFAMMALVHAYIPLVPIVGIVWSTCTVIGRRTRVRTTGMDFPPTGYAAVAGIIAIFLAPILLDIVVHPPGNIVKILAATAENQEMPHASVRELFRFFSNNTLSLRPFLWLVIVAGATISFQTGRYGALWRNTLLVVLLALITAALVFARVPTPLRGYTGRFLIALPLLGVISGTAVIVLELSRSHLRAAVASAVTLSLVFAAGCSLTRSNLFRASELRVFSRAIASENPTGSQVVLHFPPRVMGKISGLMVDLDRFGIHACVQDIDKAYFFTPERICAPEAASAKHYRLELALPCELIFDEAPDFQSLTPIGRSVLAFAMDAFRNISINVDWFFKRLSTFEQAPDTLNSTSACAFVSASPEPPFAHACKSGVCYALRRQN